MNITTEFDLRDRVIIDNCRSVVGVVTAVLWRDAQRINYEVSWISTTSECHIIEGWRLTKAES